MMRKIIILIMSIALAFTIISCQDSQTATEDQAIDTLPIFNDVSDQVIIKDSPTDNLLFDISVMDLEDGDLTSEIILDQSNLNINTVGVYELILSVKDSGGNEVTTSFLVRVVEAEDYDLVKALYGLDISYESLVSGDGLKNANMDWTVEFLWKSSHPDIITNTGIIFQPKIGDDAIDVILTVEAKPYGGSKILTRDILVTVPPQELVRIDSKRVLDFTGTSEEYVVKDGTLDLYYGENSELPYVDIESFLTLLDGAVNSEVFEYSVISEEVLKIEYSITSTDFDEVTEITETYWAEIDFDKNTFTVNNYDFFAGYAAETDSDYGEGLNYVGADYIDGKSVVIPLGSYGFDLTTYIEGTNELFLLPLDIANLLFMHDIYYQVYYNGDEIYGIDTFGLSDGDEAAIALQNQIRESSYNLKDMSKEVKMATYNYLALIMDYFYGLKAEKRYKTYYDIVQPYKDKFISGNDYTLYNVLHSLAYKMDDLHTSHVFTGYYEKPYDIILSIDDIGVKTQAFYRGLWATEDILKLKYVTPEVPSVRLISNGIIAVIHIDGFSIDTPDQFKAQLDSLPATVEDVVIDLAYNTGGNIGAVLRIFGYLTEEQYKYHSQNPADGSAVTYYIESDYNAYDYNWYVLTSSVTFSAANMFASMAKEMNIPLIGQKSSGGASSIGAFVLPGGTALMMSTNNVLSYYIDKNYESVEDGIEVDYNLTNVYSDFQLIKAINEFKNSK